MTPSARERSEQTLITLEPEFATRVRAVLRAMEALGFPMVAYTGRRTAEQQLEEYAKGRRFVKAFGGKPAYWEVVDAKAIVTTKSGAPGQESAHQRGRAVDCAFYVAPSGAPGSRWKLSWKPSEPWGAYMALGEALGLVAGGRWKHPVDGPHLEWRE